MDRNELLKMLDIKPETVKAPKAMTMGLDLASGESKTVETLVSSTVLSVDDWDVSRAAEYLYHDDVDVEIDAMADLHAAFFHQDPEVLDSVCVDHLQDEFIRTMLETPDYHVLHESTRANALAAEMASVEAARRFAAFKLRNKDERDAMRRSGDCLRAVNRAIEAAQEQVDEIDEMSNALGCGDSGAGGQIDQKRVAALYNEVRNNPKLRRIIELAGRYRRVAQSKQRQKATHGYDDMIGIVLDGDVGRLLPLERAQLADEDFELDAMRRLVERQSMCRQYRGVEHVGKGPIVVCVDESGSMDGEPVSNAKAFALAMAWVARHQNRFCALVGYSGGTEGTLCVLPPGKWDETALMDWLCHFYGAGTTMDVPLAELPFKYWDQIKAPKGKTDVILITDAIVNVPTKMEQDFNAWKQREKVNCISIIIGESGAGDLAKVSDEVHLTRGVSLAEQGVNKCLGI